MSSDIQSSCSMTYVQSHLAGERREYVLTVVLDVLRDLLNSLKETCGKRGVDWAIF